MTGTRVSTRQRIGALRQGRPLIGLAADRLTSARQHGRTLRQAIEYWSDNRNSAWKSNSHWRDGIGDDAWLEVGRDHLDMYRMVARALGKRLDPGVVVEWGCGGGANAVAFAPPAQRFVAADVSQASVDECAAQVGAVCDTPVEGLLIDYRDPAAATAGLEESCHTFLCTYVMELVAGPDEATEILRIAERLLTSGGIALIQTRYQTADFATWGRRRRDYSRHLAHTTTFGIDEFWLKAQECGLDPRLLMLVPQNRLDDRYAYYALTKP